MAKTKLKTLENGLYYTDEEIAILYRDSKDKSEELHILADLNLCEISDIKKALMRAGIDGRTIPKVKDVVKEESEIDNSGIESGNQTEMLQQFMANATLSYHDSLVKKKEELTDRIALISQELHQLTSELSECEKELLLCNMFIIQK